MVLAQSSVDDPAVGHALPDDEADPDAGRRLRTDDRLRVRLLGDARADAAADPRRPPGRRPSWTAGGYARAWRAWARTAASRSPSSTRMIDRLRIDAIVVQVLHRGTASRPARRRAAECRAAASSEQHWLRPDRETRDRGERRGTAGWWAGLPATRATPAARQQVDTYGGGARHGGSALSGKDPGRHRPLPPPTPRATPPPTSSRRGWPPSAS